MEKKESFWSKFFLATIPAIVIAFATNQINKKQAAGEKQEIKHELAVQLAKSLEQSNEKLNHWIEKYEALSNKYDDLRQRSGGGVASAKIPSGSGGGTVQGGGAKTPQPSTVGGALLSDGDNRPDPPPAQAANISGTWRTPDGTVIWTFDKGRITVSSSEMLPGMLSGSGTYRQAGATVQGSINLDVAYYLPVNQLMQFNGQLLNDGRTIAGTSTDPAGVVSAVSLHR